MNTGVMDPLNPTEAEFDTAMTEIDEELRRKSSRVVAREMLALAEYCHRYNVTIANYQPIAKRIFDWCKRLYGDRLNIDWDFGRTVVLVKGDLCKLRIIRFYGVMPIVCSPALMEIKLTQEIDVGRRVDVRNLAVTDWIVGLTPEMARRLSTQECEGILEAYARAFTAFARLEDALGKRHSGTDAIYIPEAMHDLIGSVESLFTATPNYGQSKWSSLQAVEKVVKSCLRKQGTIPKKSHNLRSLNGTAAAVGVPRIDHTLIGKIECGAEVRYDSSLVSKEDAVAAHYAALDVCAKLAPLLKQRRGQSGCEWDELRTSSTFATKRLILYNAPGEPPGRSGE